ncbi:hypothetical protein Gohar_018475 [Gossypium harknessii]|uniref:Uncharacterized protein n=1 Tax=Gossypium harknessii TaxID=34285 RepID=A0A7J9G958_9ROSI|nr:hypothetical protein [Gossypium harknessii]
MDGFLKYFSPTYLNLVRAFFSNAKLEYDESGDSVTAIISFLMGTPIRLTLEEFGDYIHLPSGGSSDEKGHFDPSLFILSGSASELNLHDPMGRGMNTNITLPHGTYFSYVLR